MKGQQPWEAWTFLRGLNRTFKEQVEKYYINHYLKRMTINMDCGEDYDEEERTMRMEGCFSFDGFADEEKSLALFREKDVHEDFLKIMKVCSILH
jgi:hypothetical protein